MNLKKKIQQGVNKKKFDKDFQAMALRPLRKEVCMTNSMKYFV